ncbi:hypothetical protein EV175_002824 [Coemansia sp. RSA 1933]|nr:hypothetical protein EV175_002824 [Coemansia sp. RSA 1933]
MDDCSAVTREDLVRWDAEAKELDDSTRSLVAISASASANRPDAVSHLVQKRLQELDKLADQVHYVQQARESLLKMTSIMGTPKAINALAEVSKTTALDNTVMAELQKAPLLRTPDSYKYAQMRLRGKQLFDAIYGRHATSVEARLQALYPELAEVIMVDSYGRLLSETTYLCARDTELCAVGSLVPQNVPDIDNLSEYFKALDAAGSTLTPVLRYTLAATAMSSANKPHLVATLAKHCEKEALSNQQMLDFVSMARESLVKMISTIGAPRVINGVASLMDAVGSDVKEALPKNVLRSRNDYNYDTVRKRGLDLWNGVYSRQAEKLENKLRDWYPDLLEVIQTDLYGRLLSECRVLDAKSTELCTIAALVPIDVPAQLKSHVLGAERMGASSAEIDSAIALAKFIAHG